MHPFPGQFDGFFAGHAVDIDTDNADRRYEPSDLRFGVDSGTVFVAKHTECRNLSIGRFHEMSRPEYNHAAEI